MPNGDRLDLHRAGIPVHRDGRIVVDEHQRTPVEGVFAVGDVSSPWQLEHVANHEAKVVAHNLLHPDALRSTDHRFVPAAVFTSPQIAGVGRTEAQCRAAGLDYAVTIKEYGTSPTAGRWRTPPGFARSSPRGARRACSGRT